MKRSLYILIAAGGMLFPLAALGQDVISYSTQTNFCEMKAGAAASRALADSNGKLIEDQQLAAACYLNDEKAGDSVSLDSIIHHEGLVLIFTQALMQRQETFLFESGTMRDFYYGLTDWRLKTYQPDQTQLLSGDHQ